MDFNIESRWLGCAVLPQNPQNPQNWAAWVWQGCHTLLICEHPCSSVEGSSLPEGSVCAFCGNIFSPTDDTDEHRWLWCAVLPRNAQNTQNWAAWVWQGCHTLLICEHPCSSVGDSSLPEGSVRAFCGNIFSPTDDTDEHRFLWCAVLPQNSQNSQNLAAWVWQGCHTLLICEHPCHLWEALLCQKVPCVLWENTAAWLVHLRQVHPLLNDYGRN